jgi:hypothetical protein
MIESRKERLKKQINMLIKNEEVLNIVAENILNIHGRVYKK